MICVVHPTGNTFVRALVEGLEAKGLLGLFATALGFPRRNGASRLLPAYIGNELARREYGVPEDRLRRFPLREISRLTARRIGLRSLIQHESGFASVDAVYRNLDGHVAKALPRWMDEYGLKSVHTYEDGALETLMAASKLGLRRSYELPIAYWSTSRRLLEEEAERLPAWEPTLGGTRDSAEKLERKTRELESAEIVICPSRFVLDSIPVELREKRRARIVPFGSPELPPPVPRPIPSKGRLRLLFAGTMTQRKGLADLFAAVKLLNRMDVELVILGSPVVPMEFYRGQNPDFIYEAPRPHQQVLDVMRTCDVLVLPSIVEGRALVQQEAMSCGLPIITTINAGADDLVEEGHTGKLVPIRSPEAIAGAIQWFADNKSLMPEMRLASHLKAQQLTWGGYVRQIADEITKCP